MISIIIPVYNEPRINDTLFGIRKQSFHDYEIIVVDGEESGSTIKLIRDEKCTKLFSKPGRAIQMNIGVEQAKGDVLLFLHADSKLPQNGLQMIDQTVKSGFNAGSFDIWFASKNFILREIISRTSSMRGRITRYPYGDQGQFFTKEFFKEIGGYSEIPLMEDIEIMQRIKKRSEKICIIPANIKTSARRWEEEGLFFVMLRNPILSILYFLGVSPKKLSRFYPRAKNKRGV
jgi:rSAM/selenodomain-associated transferase 2